MTETPEAPPLRDVEADAPVGLVERPDPIYEVAYLLWQVNQGYILAEDRAVGENWMYDDPAVMHPDDRASLPGWLDAARVVRALLPTAGDEGGESRANLYARASSGGETAFCWAYAEHGTPCIKPNGHEGDHSPTPPVEGARPAWTDPNPDCLVVKRGEPHAGHDLASPGGTKTGSHCGGLPNAVKWDDRAPEGARPEERIVHWPDADLTIYPPTNPALAAPEEVADVPRRRLMGSQERQREAERDTEREDALGFADIPASALVYPEGARPIMSQAECQCPNDCDCDGWFACEAPAGETGTICELVAGHDGWHQSGGHRWDRSATPAPEGAEETR